MRSDLPMRRASTTGSRTAPPTRRSDGGRSTGCSGRNAWGSSFVVGAGRVFPNCMQSQIANLSGSLNGRSPLQLGATVDGPNPADVFTDLGLPGGAHSCPAGRRQPLPAVRCPWRPVHGRRAGVAERRADARLHGAWGRALRRPRTRLGKIIARVQFGVSDSCASTEPSHRCTSLSRKPCHRRDWRPTGARRVEGQDDLPTGGCVPARSPTFRGSPSDLKHDDQDESAEQSEARISDVSPAKPQPVGRCRDSGHSEWYKNPAPFRLEHVDHVLTWIRCDARCNDSSTLDQTVHVGETQVEMAMSMEVVIHVCAKHRHGCRCRSAADQSPRPELHAHRGADGHSSRIRSVLERYLV